MAVEAKREGKVFYKIGEVAEITKLPGLCSEILGIGIPLPSP